MLKTPLLPPTVDSRCIVTFCYNCRYKLITYFGSKRLLVQIQSCRPFLQNPGWNLNIFSLLSFFTAIVCTYLGIFAFRLDTKSKSNKVFLLMCMSFAIWAFAYAFVYSAPDKDVLWLWFKVSSIGWCAIAGIALHFFLILTKREGILKKPWIYPLLYLPGIIFVYKAWTGIITAKDFIQTDLGWVGTGPPASIWFGLYIVYCTACMVIGLFFVWSWGKGSVLKREKKQANIIIYAASITFVLGVLTNILLPALNIPAIAPILILIWAFGHYHAITRYNLMQVTPQVAAEEILSRMTDLLILTDHDGKITKVNNRVETLLGYYERELIEKPINLVILEEDELIDALSAIQAITYSFYNHDFNYKTKYGEHIPVNVSCSAIRDQLDEIIGVAFVGRDIRQTNQLYEEILVRKRVEDALMKVQAELKMRVQERTAELEKTNEALRADVIEREQAACLLGESLEALKNSERKLADIIDYMPDGAFVISNEGIVIAWNKAMEEMTGIKAENIISKGNYEYALAFYGTRRPIMIDLALSPDDKEIERNYPFVKKENEILFTELFIPSLGREGTYLWAKAKPLYDASGKVIAAIEIVRDVTDRHHIEEVLKTEKERFKALSENSPFGLILLDKNGDFQYINPGFKEIFGYTLDDIPDGRTWLGKAYPDPAYRHEVASGWIAHFKDAMPGEKQAKIYKTICKNGTEKIINFLSVQLEYGKFLITCVDITKLKMLEEELRALSLTDDLTELYNRRGFFTLGRQQLKMAERMQKGVMLVYMDVDNMKWINDTLGHREGDNALIYVSNILKETFRESDIIARIGGDEFVVLAIEAEKNHTEVFAERLQENINKHNNTSKQPYRLSISTGITHYAPDTPDGLDSLIKVADELMYKNKRDKRSLPFSLTV
jgi:diguanylate cyclase (GGDEF)-like protein/PAS domain S-box-containing protein